MENDFQQAILEHLEFLRLQFEFRLRGMFLPSRRIQWAYLAAGVLLALLFRRWAGARLRAQRAASPDWPAWRHMGAEILERRLGLVFFVAYAWALAGIIRIVTGSSLSGFVVELVATIASVMLLASLAVRLIANRVLRTVVKWALWVYVILYFLRLLNPMQVFLTRLAVDIGDHRVNALGVLQAVILLAAYLAVARWLIRTVGTRIRANPHISPSMQVLATKILQVILYGAAFLVALDALGFDLTGLAVLTGAIGIGVGFGLQKVVSNLVSGVIILLDRSIKPGDVISLGDTFGWVETLTARYVSITTRTGKEYLIPNEDLITGQVVNWSHSNDFVRLDINFGTSYEDDWHLVRKVAVDAAMGCERVLNSRPPVCHVVNFGESSIDYVLRFWISDPSKGLTNIRGTVFVALLDAFRDNGIRIPYPQREVRMLGDETAHAHWPQD